MRTRAKGSCPQILLEMTVIWNPVSNILIRKIYPSVKINYVIQKIQLQIKACIRSINPREEKYMQTEIKFKRQVFLRNVMRLKSIIVWFIDIGKILQYVLHINISNIIYNYFIISLQC